jgi:hypothetical protein
MTQLMTERGQVKPGRYHQETILTGVTGEWVQIPAMGMKGGSVNCSIIAGAGTGKVQYTNSPDTDVDADTANEHDWTLGNVTGSNNDTFDGQISAVRGVSISGSIVFEVMI